MKASRKTPRPFDLHWGKGQIVEEATYAGEHHEPALQLLEFEDGSHSVRFCYYDERGRFQRSPLIINRGEMEGMRGAISKAPKLRSFLRELVK